MTATVTDLAYRRALKEVERATAALAAISKRTQERTRLSKADTDARRARLDEDLRVQLMDEVRDRLPCDVEFREGA